MTDSPFPHRHVPSTLAVFAGRAPFRRRQLTLLVHYHAGRVRHFVIQALRERVSWAAWITIVGVVVACAAVIHGPAQHAVSGSPSEVDVTKWIGGLRTVPQRTTVPGYGRECPGPCVFGQPWTDATSAPMGHNSCTTREDVLARDIRQALPVPGKPCARHGGTLLDPYSGRSVRLGDSYRDVHIDHVFPLAAAWDMGAASWPQERRERFANDVDLNLLAVTAAANMAKSDGLPSVWLPAEPWQCFYVWRVAVVAWAYDLALSDDDIKAMRRAARTCP